MSSGAKLPIALAAEIAGVVVDRLSGACERIAIAGSVRRRKAMVGDLEIVAVPRMVPGPIADLFAPPPMVSALDAVLAGEIACGNLRPVKGGDRYKQFVVDGKAGGHPEITLDLFIVLPPASYAVIFTIRTGPSDFSRECVTALRERGMRCHEGRVLLLDGDVPVPCPDEATFLRLCGVPWAEPWERKASGARKAPVPPATTNRTPSPALPVDEMPDPFEHMECAEEPIRLANDRETWRALETHVLGNGELGPARRAGCGECSLTHLTSKGGAPDPHNGKTACAVGVRLYREWTRRGQS